jgi:phospholipase C
VNGGGGTETLIGDADPTGDVCSSTSANVRMQSPNVGDLLNKAGISWGFFSGGFNLQIVNPNGTTGCKRSTKSAVTGVTKADYIPHHQPFQYYASTANPNHTRPTSVSEIGHNGAANHQYDIDDFFTAVSQGNFPAVSYLKAPGYQDGHAGYSDPLDEQTFIVDTINFLEKQPEWSSTAVIISYDDSDGWYDHQMSPILNQSETPADVLNGPGLCGATTTASLAGFDGNPNAQGRCGYGPRLPFLVISPWAKENFVDHTITDQSSVVRFIEDNWLEGTRIPGSFSSFDSIAGPIENMFDFGREESHADKLFLNPSTGEPTNRSLQEQ